jgi:hypothetical protein
MQAPARRFDQIKPNQGKLKHAEGAAARERLLKLAGVTK